MSVSPTRPAVFNMAASAYRLLRVDRLRVFVKARATHVTLGLLGVFMFLAPTPAYAAGESFLPPGWCSRPSFESSNFLVAGLNSAVNEISGWGVLGAFVGVGLIATLIVFFAFKKKWGQEWISKLRTITLGVGLLILGPTILGIILGIIGAVVGGAGCNP